MISNETRLILIEDRSTSMINIPRFPVIRNQMIRKLARECPEMQVTLYAMSARIEAVAYNVSIDKVRMLQPHHWRQASLGTGGLLKGGTALKAAIVQARETAAAWRGLQYRGRIIVMILTDGYCRCDNTNVVEAQWALGDFRRALDVTFHLVGFIHYRVQAEFEMFRQTVGIMDAEVHIEWHDDNQIARAADTSMDTAFQRITQIPEKPRSDRRSTTDRRIAN